MKIDPRHMQQLLQLTTIRAMETESATHNANTADFNQLLQDILLMSYDKDAKSSVVSPAAELHRTSVHPAYIDHLSNIHMDEIRSIIQDKASQYQVDPALVMAVVHTESSFDPHAVSSAGAKGLMQLMDGTAAGLGVSNPFDPVENIDGGVRYLASLLNRYDGQTRTALAAYNAGPGRIDRLGIDGDAALNARYDQLPQETQNYINKVMAAYDYYRTRS